MPRIARERPRRTILATIGVVVVLAAGWLTGAGTAGSATTPRAEATTVVSTETETQTVTVTHTVTAAARRVRRGAQPARRQRTGNRGGAKHKQGR